MSAKIKINLNPNKEERVDAVIAKVTSYMPYLGMAAAGFLVIVLLLQVWVFFVAANGVGLNMEWGKWQEKYEAIEGLKKDIAILTRERQAFISKKERASSAASLLANIFNALPDNIWLTRVSIDSAELSMEGKVVAVKADSDLLGAISNVFIQNLKKEEPFNGWYKKIKIKGTKNIKYRGLDVIEFEIICKI